MGEDRRRHGSVRLAVLLVPVMVAVVGVFWWSVYAGLVVLMDGASAGLILGAAVSFGMWGTTFLGLNDLPWRWHILVGAVAGVWALATLMLVLGTWGVMGRGVWTVILVCTATLGVVRIANLNRMRPKESGELTGARASWFWLVATPFLFFALLAASTPPGLLWAEEAGGYDVLEYHLGCPKEFLGAGRIGFLRHNVYANFPFNAEMLYLASMILSGGAHEGVFVAKFINLGLAVLAVFAAWVAGREFGKSVGVATGVLAATTPWLTYLSGVAFVENGVLFMGMASAAMLCRYVQSEQASGEREQTSNERLRWAALIGAAAGASAGFKYTGFAMVAGPVFAAFALVIVRSAQRRWADLAVFAATSLAASSPWLIKNVAYTGNPVFPLAANVFPAKADVWTDALAERWHRGHQPPAEEASLGGRLQAFGLRVLVDVPYGRMGPIVFLLAIPILISRQRSEIDIALSAIFVVQVAVWLFVTHLYARFAVPLIIPLVVLAGRSVVAGDRSWARGLSCAGIGLAIAVNLMGTTKLIADHFYAGGERVDLHLPPSYFLEGRVPGYEYVGGINGDLPPDARVLLVAEVRHFYIDRACDYAVVFSPSAFHEAVARDDSPAAVSAWLRSQGYTHVYVSFSEMSRFAATYGWDEHVGPGLFGRLQDEVLRPIRSFAIRPEGRPYGQLYEVMGS